MKILGGNACLNGINYISKTKIAQGRLINNKININIKERKFNTNKYLEKLFKIPFIRGITIILNVFIMNYKLTLAMLLFGIIIIQILLQINTTLNIGIDLKNSFITSIIFLAFIKYSSFGKYHGAEHKAFNAYINNDLSIEKIKQQSRICTECGTNFLVFIFVIRYVLLLFPINDIIALLISISFAYELFILENKNLIKLFFPLYYLGGLVQKYIVTTEPNDKQIELAQKTIFKLIEEE